MAIEGYRKSMKIEENVFEFAEDAEMECYMKFVGRNLIPDKFLIPKGTVFAPCILPDGRFLYDSCPIRLIEQDNELYKMMNKEVQIKHKKLYSELLGYFFYITKEQLQTLPLKFRCGSADRIIEIMQQIKDPMFTWD